MDKLQLYLLNWKGEIKKGRESQPIDNECRLSLKIRQIIENILVALVFSQILFPLISYLSI